MADFKGIQVVETSELREGEARRVSRREFIKRVIASGAVASSASFMVGGLAACTPRRAAVAGSVERLISLNVNGQVRRVDVLPQETLVFGITRERMKMAVSSVPRDDIARRIHAVRRSIEKVTSGESVLFLREIDPANLYSLQRDLIAPVADVLAGSEKVIVVGDGPLHTIPFELFVSQWNADDQQKFRAIRSDSDGSAGRPFLGEYTVPKYLGSQFRFAYLPSLSALTSQRLYPKAGSNRAHSLIAFADPDFLPEAGTTRQFSAATRATMDSMGSSMPRLRDGTPSIPRLRETADEAREIARLLGGSSELFIGGDAQEHTAKSGDLKTARFVLFATH